MTIRFGRASCSDLGFSERREWLVTNGLGGYALGTVAGLLTRRYHGLLIAATSPPAGRTLLVPKIDETLSYAGRDYALAVNRWSDGTIDPHGERFIESFELDGTAPVWRFACADALVEKRIWMEQGADLTYVRYRVARASAPVSIALKVFIDGRDHHGSSRASGAQASIDAIDGGFRFRAAPGSPDGSVVAGSVSWRLDGTWYYGFDLARERERGLDDRDDHVCAATGTATLRQGEAITVELRAGAPGGAQRADPWDAFASRERSIVAGWTPPIGAAATPPWVARLVLASDQFVVTRDDGDTVIAGYPWFADWGRDTMISLPGIALVTKRYDVARSILETFARYVDGGMIPNRFPDSGGAVEYNTVDATLWYVIAIERLARETRDGAFAQTMLPVVDGIVQAHVRGTRHGITCDDRDGLLAAGEPGVQLTWMDAKVGDRVVTPRIGKPVEVNALWANALVAAGRLAALAGAPRDRFDALAARARDGFGRFWRGDLGYCSDVLDGPDGDDAALRPNQIFAIALPEALLDPPKARAVVDACGRALLTSYGLRTLAPDDPRYAGRYEGDPAKRDGAYHEGTAWAWLLGPYAVAHFRANGDAKAALALLAPLGDALFEDGLGTIGEISDGDPPHAPRGCVAQAWSVAQTLEAWTMLASHVRSS